MYLSNFDCYICFSLIPELRLQQRMCYMHLLLPPALCKPIPYSGVLRSLSSLVLKGFADRA